MYTSHAFKFLRKIILSKARLHITTTLLVYNAAILTGFTVEPLFVSVKVDHGKSAIYESIFRG